MRSIFTTMEKHFFRKKKITTHENRVIWIPESLSHVVTHIRVDCRCIEFATHKYTDSVLPVVAKTDIVYTKCGGYVEISIRARGKRIIRLFVNRDCDVSDSTSPTCYHTLLLFLSLPFFFQQKRKGRINCVWIGTYFNGVGCLCRSIVAR